MKRAESCALSTGNDDLADSLLNTFSNLSNDYSQPGTKKVSVKDELGLSRIKEGSGGACTAGACPILDTHTPECDHEKRSIRKPFRTASDRRLFSRMMLGLQQPGRYYFLTLTSSPQSPPIQKGWINLRNWLKREYGRLPYIRVVTLEGFGVIHMVIRLRPRQKNIDIKKVRAYWTESHKAEVVDIRRVKESKKEDLANYLSDQRRLKKMGAEFSWQPMIDTWGWSTGWIPKRFTRHFGQFWQNYTGAGAPDGLRAKIVHDWIQKCHKNQKVMIEHNWQIYSCTEWLNWKIKSSRSTSTVLSPEGCVRDKGALPINGPGGIMR